MVSCTDLPLLVLPSMIISYHTGIIGTATDATDDNNSFNRDRYNEFLGLLCNCDPISLPAETTFTEVDVSILDSCKQMCTSIRCSNKNFLVSS